MDSLVPGAGQSTGFTRLYLMGSGFGPQTEVTLDEEKLEQCEPLLKALEATTGGKGK